ncbi:hypothetical protein GCK32_020773, partial [Trichostrongylus colubriformis]
SAPSPHSRFIDGLRRRTRLRSLNVPSHGHESLDSDLGFPPICSPPPPSDDIASSTQLESCGARFRRRTLSDAAQTGMNYNGSTKRQSGVLVIFPHSPSCHGDSLHGHSTPASVNKRHSSYGSNASKSFEGISRYFYLPTSFFVL